MLEVPSTARFRMRFQNYFNVVKNKKQHVRLE